MATCLAVWFAGWNVFNSYTPPNEERDAQQEHGVVMTNMLVKLKPRCGKDKWLWVGDQNATCENSVAIMIAERWRGNRINLKGEEAHNEEGPIRKATRWGTPMHTGGAVDHIVSNAPRKLKEADLRTKEKYRTTSHCSAKSRWIREWKEEQGS